MRAGSLKESIKIYSYTKTTNELNEVIKTKTLFKTLRAEVKYVSGKEAEQDRQLTPMQVVIFNIRYDESIDETMTIEYKGKFYNIRYIEPIRNSITQITTERIHNGS